MPTSERQAIQDGLLASMRLSTEPMVLSDPSLPDNPIIAINQAFQDLTGYTGAEITGRNCRFLQGPGTDRGTVASMGACLRAGEGCIQWLVNYRKNGSQFWNLLFISPVLGRDGGLLFFFANQHNLSAGSPLGLEEFPIGIAHMPPPQQAEFHALLLGAGQDARDAEAAGTPDARARALEAALAAARQLAFLSTRLAAGPQP